ncbi:MAG TPA: polysaccharide deacetylase family protein, partial [Clostridiaceae bacterium]|nr:polysaccharide deacetylase family protein [Clostridiaceae bacterium]
ESPEDSQAYPSNPAVKNYVDTADALKADKATQIIAGAGLTGGGDLSENRTINVVSADDGITVNADNIKLNIVNDLVTTSATRPLSATQGKKLQDEITQLAGEVSANMLTLKNELSYGDFEATNPIIKGDSGVVSTFTHNDVSPISGLKDARLVVNSGGQVNYPALNIRTGGLVGDEIGTKYWLMFKYKVNSGIAKLNAVNNGLKVTSIYGQILTGEGEYSKVIEREGSGDLFGRLHFDSNYSAFDIQIDDIMLINLTKSFGDIIPSDAELEYLKSKFSYVTEKTIMLPQLYNDYLALSKKLDDDNDSLTEAIINAKLDVIVEETGSFTISEAHLGKTVVVTSEMDVVVTIPYKNNFRDGSKVSIIQNGEGRVFVLPENPNNFIRFYNSTGDNTKTPTTQGMYSLIELTLKAPSDWYVTNMVGVNPDYYGYIIPQKMELGVDFVDEMDSLSDWTAANVNMSIDSADKYSGNSSIHITKTVEGNSNLSRNITIADGDILKSRIAIKIKSELNTFLGVQLAFHNHDFTKSYVANYDVSENHFEKDKWVVLGGKRLTENGGVSPEDITGFRIAFLGATTDFIANVDMFKVGVDMYPGILITFDDGKASDYSIAYDEMKKRNMVGTSYIVSDFIGTDGYMTEANLIEMDSYGWCIANHTQSHTNLTTLETASDVAAAWQGCKDYLDSIGLTKTSSYCAYPYNAANETVFAGTELFGCKLGRISGLGHPNIFDNNRFMLEVNCQSTDYNEPISVPIGFIEGNLKYGRVPVLLFHGLHEQVVGQRIWTRELFAQLLDYIQEIGLKTLTIDDLYNLISSDVTTHHE